MSKLVRTGYDYIPVAGEEYFPEGKAPVNDGDITVARGTDSNLVRDKKGNLRITDTNGNRRTT